VELLFVVGMSKGGVQLQWQLTNAAQSDGSKTVSMLTKSILAKLIGNVYLSLCKIVGYRSACGKFGKDVESSLRMLCGWGIMYSDKNEFWV
jgi:hypothetical protein